MILKFEMLQFLMDNPPNDYELILLVIILHDAFYDKKARIIKKCHARHSNLQHCEIAVTLGTANVSGWN